MSQLAYQVHPGRGPYLAMLHGFLSSSAQWQLNLEALGEVCRPVTIELWGHGASPASEDDAAYHPSGYAAALEHIRTSLGGESWFVCGYSLGAGITMQYAHQYPQHVHGQIITNSQSGFAGPELVARWLEELPTVAGKIRRDGIAAIERIAVHPRFAKRIPEPVRSHLLADAERILPEAIARCLEVTNPNVSARSIAPANAIPALLCFGIHEKRFHDSKAWAEQNMDGLEIVDLDAGHAVNIEDADGFNRAVASFIKANLP